ncbi:hypothetical protein [Fredinandcohnia sp. 179-A 10B2 NHS]|uniref:hypothetical protein n=1 Tax=Fredinandcohnia sp. 179-A 10B2 NHS TaxID=3235176 RepID=UPI00399F9CC8
MKWKNYGLWVSLASILYMVFRDLGVQIDLTTWETYVTAVLGILATLGIVSNPDKGKGFFDKVPTSPTEAIAQVAQHLQNQGQQNQQTGSNLQNLNQPMENQQMGIPQQNAEQSFQGQLHTQQSQPLDSQKSYNPNNYSNTSPSSPQQSQDTEPSSVPSEMYDESQSIPNDSLQDAHPTNQSTLDRDSVHGMPPPPNERM